MIIYTIIYIFSSIQPPISAKPSNNLPITFQSALTALTTPTASQPPTEQGTQTTLHRLYVITKVRARGQR